MELVFESDKLEEQCTSARAAKKLFGGDQRLAAGLLSRVNALKQAETLKDIVVQTQFRLHKLRNKRGRNLEGCFAIDVASKHCPWRLIIRPLDENGEPFVPCNIDEIAHIVEVVGITEVSRHYE